MLLIGTVYVKFVLWTAFKSKIPALFKHFEGMYTKHFKTLETFIISSKQLQMQQQQIKFEELFTTKNYAILNEYIQIQRYY